MTGYKEPMGGFQSGFPSHGIFIIGISILTNRIFLYNILFRIQHICYVRFIMYPFFGFT